MTLQGHPKSMKTNMRLFICDQ